MAHCTLALGPDAAGGLLRGVIERAETRLDVAVYEVGPSYAALLAAAARRGVAVRLLLDAHAGANATAVRIVAGSGVECRVLGGHPGAEAHWKLLMGAGTLAAGTGNLLRRDAPPPGEAGTREWWVAVSGRAAHLLSRAHGSFNSAWREAAPPPAIWRRLAELPSVPPVGVPPQRIEPFDVDIPAQSLRLVAGGSAVAALLSEQIAGARRRVLVTVPYVHTHVESVGALLDALCNAAARGAAVRLLLGAPPDPRDAVGLPAPALRHVAVRVMDPLRSTTGHAKGLVADAAAVVGSANWSAAGLGGNRESALLLDDGRAADWFAAALELDWALARPLPGPPDG